MCKNGSRKENEIQFKQNNIYGCKGRQKKETKLIRKSESREHSENQEIQTINTQ